MKSLTLKEEKNGLFSVTLTDTVVMEHGAVRNVVLAKHNNLCVGQTAAILSDIYCIPKLEISTAVHEMENNGHNVASFGAMGNFVCSFFDGQIH